MITSKNSNTKNTTKITTTIKTSATTNTSSSLVIWNITNRLLRNGSKVCLYHHLCGFWIRKEGLQTVYQAEFRNLFSNQLPYQITIFNYPNTSLEFSSIHQNSISLISHPYSILESSTHPQKTKFCPEFDDSDLTPSQYRCHQNSAV